jgi:hypothetical protein
MKNQVESGIELSKGMKVFFVGEKLPMIVKSVNENFAICTRKLHIREDSDILKHKVAMGAYMSFTDAYQDLKDEMVYSIIDFKNNLRGPDNYGAYCDYKNEKQIEKVLSLLEKGEVELSRRNQCIYNLDFERTLNQN